MAHTDTRNGTLHAPLIYRLTRKITNAYKQNFVFFYLHLNIICLFWAHGTFYWSACIKPGKCTVMYCCVVGMSLLPLFTLVFIVFWNCSDNVVFFFHLISNTKWMDTFYHNTVLYKTYRTSFDHKLMWRSTVSWAILIPRLIKMISTSNWELFWF
jgi:hypothetical protein